MRTRHILLIILLFSLAFGAGRLSAATGTLDPPGPPGATFSYTLENIYNRLNDGAAGAQSAFAEPASGPATGTGHSLDEIMALAPAIDDIHGATQTHVSVGQTFWGLTSDQWGPVTGTRLVASVPKTGQTGCWDADGALIVCAGTGQDGEHQQGVAWPNPRFITGTTGIVTDTQTGLIWLENANCFGARTWTQALTDANTLNSGECGLTDGSVEGDWRLPNVRELQSLVHYDFRDPTVPNTAGTGQWAEGDPFSGVQSNDYWSSTTYAHDRSAAWFVYMHSSDMNGSDKTITNSVWPVRGGQ